MISNKRFNIKSIIAAGLLLTTVACSDNSTEDVALNSDTRNEENAISFNVSLESEVAGSRAQTDGENWEISSGGLIDKLVFAVYKKIGENSYELTNEFRKDGQWNDETWQNTINGVKLPIVN